MQDQSYTMTMPLMLTGKIFREEGMIVAELPQIGQATWGHDLVQVMQDVPRLVVEYFDAVKQLGRLAERLIELGAVAEEGKLNISIHVDIDRDAMPQPEGFSTFMQNSFVLPVAA